MRGSSNEGTVTHIALQQEADAITLTPNPQVQTVACPPLGACCPRYYLMSYMPVKGGMMWLVFFCVDEHAVLGFNLEVGFADGVSLLGANSELSWTAPVANGEWWQHKLCFDCPAIQDRSTWNSCMPIVLVERTNHVEKRTRLGFISILSNSTQRNGTKRLENIKKRCCIEFADDAERASKIIKMVDNDRAHNPKQRHFRNGKGGRQRAKNPSGHFRQSEFDNSVPLYPTDKILQDPPISSPPYTPESKWKRVGGSVAIATR